ncbi:MAG: ATP-binding protein [Faecousia sp.]
MRIYKMTATFGKLEHETLVLEPGLNIITAPNEWGKSTWCAFLMAMLYGLDTRAKSTKTALADKDRYAPWSGVPMEGRVELNWNGRDITIERRTKRRVPLGEFTAYETESGLPVKELTAANCGQTLLGVEQTVFRRAGFIRFSDLPVTQDEALRRRLNALVTTGDESGAADRLAEQLKDLKNRCRYNKSGLLPQAEAQRDALEDKLTELESLDIQCRKLKMRLDEIKDEIGRLSNHRQALAYAEAEENAGRMAQARDARDQAEQILREQEEACAKLPPREEAEQKTKELRAFREQWNAIQMEKQMLPEVPQEPKLEPPFAGLTPEQAREMACRDGEAYAAASSTRLPLLLLLLGILGLAAAGVLTFLKAYIPGAGAAVVALIAIVWGGYELFSSKKQVKDLEEKYGSTEWRHWADPVADYEAQLDSYNAALKVYRESGGDVEVRYLVLRKRRESLCGGQEPEALLDFWQQVLNQWDAYHTARRETMRAQSHLDALSALVRPVEQPAFPDNLTYSEAETAQLLSDCAVEQQRLQNRLGQYQGRMEALGDKGVLQQKLDRCSRRIAALEDTYAALTIALETLADARAELQRRFAPRIAKRAQELLSAMTGGRYHSLAMGEDFSLQAGAGEEDTLRDCFWRSDGTVDQLYLALRLAVAEELTPEAPLILDDALVRFDDDRMKAAVEILKTMAENRQVICFTCQEREKMLNAK